MARERLTREQINDILEAAYDAGQVSDFEAAIQRLEDAESSVMVSEALEGLAISLMTTEAFLARRPAAKALPEVPKGYKRMYADVVRRSHRITALGRTHIQFESMFTRALKKAFQEQQGRVLRRLRETFGGE